MPAIGSREARQGYLLRLDRPGRNTRLALFTGKGGVGKTTIASGVAVALADGGHRVLLVSTDPHPTSLRSSRPGPANSNQPLPACLAST